MARTTYEFKIKSQNMMEDIHLHLMKEGFQCITEKGEKIYRKNASMYAFLSVIMAPPSCNLSFNTIGKNVVMEAWVKQAGALGKELAPHNLKGLDRDSLQKFYNDIVNFIENY